MSNFETYHTHHVSYTLNQGLESGAPCGQRFQGRPVVKRAWILAQNTLFLRAFHAL